jgi:hypothetical protein
MRKVLLTTIQRPLGVENETCTPNILAEMYHAQVTLAQGAFSIRSICTGWGLEFIAANLETPTTVLHYPALRDLARELRKGYDYVGIGFVICTFPKMVDLCRLIREISPSSRIVLGGYGTVLKECDRYADFICREEGVNFMKRLLGEKEVTTYNVPLIERNLKVLSVTTHPETIIPAGLGCSRGCDFCCTSHFFRKQYHPLLRTGRELHGAMRSADSDGRGFRNIGVIDEDFLADADRIRPMMELNSQETEKPILFSCLTSMQSLSQYSTDELLKMGLSGAWVGIESKNATYPKLGDVDALELFRELKGVGISVLASMIVGYDWHNEKAIREDFAYLLSLRPTFSQFMIYSPCPQTPLYNRLVDQNRLLDVPYKYHDGFHLLFKHPHFSPERLESLVRELFSWEFEELGPSVFRVLENQLDGYLALRESDQPLFRARAGVHRKLCLDIYPLLPLGIRKAPSARVRGYLRQMKKRVESHLRIPLSTRAMKTLAPLLYYYSVVRSSISPNPQPPVTIKRYHDRPAEKGN